jgi:hypothetical protein
MRLPDDVRAELEAAAGALQLPAWRVVIDAIRAYVGSGPALTDEQKRVVRAVLKLHQGGWGQKYAERSDEGRAERRG